MTEIALVFAIGLLGLAFSAYLARWVLARFDRPGALPIGVLVNLAALVYFKYSSFVVVN